MESHTDGTAINSGVSYFRPSRKNVKRVPSAQRLANYDAESNTFKDNDEEQPLIATQVRDPFQYSLHLVFISFPAPLFSLFTYLIISIPKMSHSLKDLNGSFAGNVNYALELFTWTEKMKNMKRM